ncbi:SPOR domain-containing protein [Ferrimonas marina]|uniref:Sporulation related domain-containing protein n=1 Tax=Ferrimonas marina TaxID=299255 RepID=A0A1M5Z611_9GAMM|nr:SPOR domain-containing protein [Ferrimonas marina]SHI19640.1 Sporulation related domain-containing protein [Ferrimonas marina]
MNNLQRITLGAIGGITPFLITLLSIDFHSVFGGYKALDWVGLAVRCIILIFLGALVTFMHKNETENFKLFQLGLAAPALLATYINGSPGNSQMLPSSADNGTTVSISLLPQAHADASERRQQYLNEGMIREPQVSAYSRFLRGAFGKKIETSGDDKFFVIAGSHQARQSAENQVAALKEKGFEATVFKPYGDSKHFSVVIAAYVSKSEATQVRDLALRNGLPSDTFIWTF